MKGRGRERVCLYVQGQKLALNVERPFTEHRAHWFGLTGHPESPSNALSVSSEHWDYKNSLPCPAFYMGAGN